MADVYFTRFDVGFGNILYVITTTGNDPPLTTPLLTYSRCVDRISRFVGFIQTAFLVYKLVRFFSPGSKDTYLTTRSTLALFSTYLAPFPPHRPFTKHG